jgi:hypothetical protein
MRSLRLILTASGFAAYLLGMIALSAITTSVVHSAFAPRVVPLALVGE